MNRLHPSDISIGQNEYTVYELYTMMKEGRIELEKRNYRWTPKQRSISIESILLGLTMTPIYIDAANPNKWIILDGENRLRAIRDFIDNRLRLTGIEFFTEFEGCLLKQLPNVLYRKLLEAKLTVYGISPSVPPQVRMSLIRRIVPDKKSHSKRAILESLFTPSGRRLFHEIMYYPTIEEILKDERKIDQFQLILQFIGHFFKYFNSDRSELNQIENVIFFLNERSRVSGSEILSFWNTAIDRIYQVFGNYSLQTSIHSRSKNTETLSPLVLYFGNIEDKVFRKILYNQKEFISNWFHSFKEGNGRKYFNRKSPNSAIEEIKRIVDSL